MTNITHTEKPSIHIKQAVRKTLKRRYAIEYMFKGFGFGAIALAVIVLCFLLYSLVTQGLGAFRQTHIAVEISYPQFITVKPSVLRDKNTNKILKNGDGQYLFDFSKSKIGHITYEREGRNRIRFDLSQLSGSDYKHVVMAAEIKNFHEALSQGIITAGGSDVAEDLINIGAQEKVRHYLRNNPNAVGKTVKLQLPAQADFDYWWRKKGRYLEATTLSSLDAQINQLEAGILQAADADESRIASLETQKSRLKIERTQLMGRFERFLPVIKNLKKDDLISINSSLRILTNLDASEADYAGLRSAIIGTAYTMAVTFFISFFFGVGAAIWLEEFAPKGKFSDIIEVNINNLAAVPSIVKGILGLLVFQIAFGLPRGTPLLGGIVLSLIAMPTIIVASRAALKSVPPSLKQGALGLGASNMQAVFHHVAPAALPGMLTGTIIGLAQALGETAPLLMIGMKSFAPTPPSGMDGFTESSTTIAATIYNWFSLGKDSFNELASAAILVLLFFLLCMNALAVYLRKKFELDW